MIRTTLPYCKHGDDMVLLYRSMDGGKGASGVEGALPPLFANNVIHTTGTARWVGDPNYYAEFCSTRPTERSLSMVMRFLLLDPYCLCFALGHHHTLLSYPCKPRACPLDSASRPDPDSMSSPGGNNVVEVDEHGSVGPNPDVPNAAVIEQAVGPSPLTRMSQDILDLQSSVLFLSNMVNYILQTLNTRLPGICNQTVRHDPHAATACDIAAVDSRQLFPPPPLAPPGVVLRVVPPPPPPPLPRLHNLRPPPLPPDRGQHGGWERLPSGCEWLGVTRRPVLRVPPPPPCAPKSCSVCKVFVFCTQHN